ncbi:MAG: hypothetical protein HQK94_09890 [Nitrospirae bacterium]|nr:hypothetical protein [Nitrospirota bacterium]MBF0536149.1 hypothetical protein [Nitrospirota bacterium]
MVSGIGGQTNPYAAQQMQGSRQTQRTHGHHHHKKANTDSTQSSQSSGTRVKITA